MGTTNIVWRRPYGGGDRGPMEKTTVTWIRRSPLNVARGGLTDATVDGTVYAIGGFTSGFGAELDAVEVYDAARDRWRRVAPLPTARGCPAAATAHGHVY